MKTWILGVASVLALTVLPAQPSQAHGVRHARSHISIGYGYPAYYRPYRYYPSYYSSFDIWPRYTGARVRTVRDRGEVRTQKLYVYPAAGQNAEQTSQDRYQCHVWAVDATDFDPTQGAGTAAEAEGYGRAFTACMEGRDYVVK
jgi:hypothetical protein